MTTTVASSKPKALIIGIWTLRVLLSAMFLVAAAMKLSGQPMMVAEFDAVGLGQWFRYFTGLVEVVGGVAILVPRFSLIGAGLLLLVDVGAFVAQVSILHVDWIHTVVLAAIIGLLFFLERKKAKSL